MTEKTIELEIPLLLPGVEDKRDQCMDRLEAAMQAHKGIQRVHLEREKDPVCLCLHYNPNLVSVDEIQHTSRRAGAKIVKRYHHDMFDIEGMDCSDCALVVEHSISRLEGVLNASVSYAAQTMTVEYDSQQVSRGVISRRVRQLGYSVPARGSRKWVHQNRELLFSLGAGFSLLLGWLGNRFLGFPTQLSLGLYLLAYLAGGYDVTRHALRALRQRQFDTDLLMVIAALGAAALGDFPEGALLLFLFSLGHALEERALDRTRSAIRSLAYLAPNTALVSRGGEEKEIPVDQLAIGDTVVVRPGGRLPVDGQIISGHSSVDQSPVTGESIPVDKSPGDQVFAASINGEGALEVRVTRLSRDSTLARVIQLVERAQTQKSPTQQLTDRFTRIFVPVVLVGDLLLILVPPFFGVPFAVSFLRAMTLLVATSPCALALGTPAAVLSGLAQAARNGVLVKGSAHLENLGQLRAIAFDKTGTITQGRPQVTDIWVSRSSSKTDGRSSVDLETEILRLAAALESRSNHPLAQAILRAAEDRGLDLPRVGETSLSNGQGVRAEIEGKMVWAGNLGLLQQAGVEVPPNVLEKKDRLEAEGKTTVLVAQENAVLGLIGVADVIRPSVKEVVTDLSRLGLQEFVMLTGDNPRVAQEIARQSGMTDFQAGLLPEDKLLAIRNLLEKYGKVAMIGDGVNDAPALANATVGIAMGGAGTDVALETADVALMADDLTRLPFAVGLGRATRKIIHQNLVIAMGVIAGLVVLTLSGLTNIGAAIVFHEGSTLLVILNALRLLRFSDLDAKGLRNS